mgnify:FL=1
MLFRSRLSFANAGRMVAFYEELMRQESTLLEDEESMEKAHEKPLRTKPLARAKQERAVEPELESEEEQGAPDLEPLPLDDEPLVVKPLRKDD